jgi:hypothetical protein
MPSVRTRALFVATIVLLGLAAGCGGVAGTGSNGVESESARPLIAGEHPAALPLWQRVLQSGELAGFVTDSRPPQFLNLDEFVAAAKPAFIRITPAEAKQQLASAGFRRALIAGLALPGEDDVLAASVVVELASAAQASRASAFFTADSLEPCANTCNITISKFDVPEIGATGSHRSRDAAAAGAGDDKPFEAYDVGFTDGAFLYDIFVLTPRPGMVERAAIAAAARALYERVHGSPALPDEPTAAPSSPAPTSAAAYAAGEKPTPGELVALRTSSGRLSTAATAAASPPSLRETCSRTAARPVPRRSASV